MTLEPVGSRETNPFNAGRNYEAYLVCKITEPPAFEVRGLFDDSTVASELCKRHNTKDSVLWFIMPLALYFAIPDETFANKNIYYPMDNYEFSSDTVQDGYYIMRNGEVVPHWKVRELLNEAYCR